VVVTFVDGGLKSAPVQAATHDLRQ
jgi:hypothetical protein